MEVIADLILAYIKNSALVSNLRVTKQCFHFVPPENTRKPLVFWFSQGI